MNKKIKIASVLMAVTVFIGASALVFAKKKTDYGKVFFIYSDRGSRLNHYIPSGWMGDYGDLKVNLGWAKDVKKPTTGMTSRQKAHEKIATKTSKTGKNKTNTCIKISYSGERKQGAGWAGVYWQHPANNWGDKRGGYDLGRYKQLSFWAKGETGQEVIDKFFIGGITGQTEEGDSDEASISPVELTKKWKLYEIDLQGLDLSHIIGGFGFAANADANPDGFTMFLDEVRLHK